MHGTRARAGKSRVSMPPVKKPTPKNSSRTPSANPNNHSTQVDVNREPEWLTLFNSSYQVGEANAGDRPFPVLSGNLDSAELKNFPVADLICLSLKFQESWQSVNQRQIGLLMNKVSRLERDNSQLQETIQTLMPETSRYPLLSYSPDQVPYSRLICRFITRSSNNSVEMRRRTN